MNADMVDSIVLDEAFLTLYNERRGRLAIIISTRDIARWLWKEYRVPYKKDAEVVREKMRTWWQNKPWIREPRSHKKIGNMAVYISSPMNYDYCCLEKRMYNSLSLIVVYSNQRQFNHSSLSSTKTQNA